MWSERVSNCSSDADKLVKYQAIITRNNLFERKEFGSDFKKTKI